MVKRGILYSDIMESKRIKEWVPGIPTLGTDKKSKQNGHLPADSMVRLPCIGGYARAERNTGIAWAMMVQAAIQYNRKGWYTQQERSVYGTDVEIDRLIVKGSNSAYRDYHHQVEAFLDWTRRKKPKNAAEPNFTSKDAISIINSLAAKLGYLDENMSGGWDNIPDSLTDSSLIGKNQYTNKFGYPDGSLAGSGTSNHGLGSALDLNFGLAEEASIGSGIRHWVEDFGKGYGFWGYYKDNETEYKETRGKGNFEESWHLNYYGPNGPKSRSK